MSASVPSDSDTQAPRPWLAAVLLAAAIAVVYGPAIQVPFIFDDTDSVLENTSIRALWPLYGTPESRGPLNPMPKSVLSGRPLVNLSLALNYACGKFHAPGYHAVNFVLHFFSSLLLLSIIRSTLRAAFCWKV